VLVNPLAATPLFSPSRAVLFGLVVYKPGDRKVAKPKICRMVPVIRQCALVPPVVSTDLSAMASPTLVINTSDVARRVVECNLGVAANGLT
jgi:hypothetical protein